MYLPIDTKKEKRDIIGPPPDKCATHCKHFVTCTTPACFE